MIRTLLLAGAMLCAGTAAEAHAFLDKADPGVGSTVPAAPSLVMLTFTEGLEPSFSSIAVLDAQGQRVDLGDAHPDGDDPTRLAVGLKPLAPGSYTVEWRATSVDTHKTNGHFTFTVAP